MEIESENSSKILLKEGAKRELGRGLGFDTKDRTISRRQISFLLHKDEDKSQNPKFRVHFEVIGKNPIWVYERADEIRCFRTSEGGEMVDGDRFCLSGKKPVWFTLKDVELEGGNGRDMKRERERGDERELEERVSGSSVLTTIGDLELELKSIEISSIDAVKEFGFLVMGHEFEHYPKHMICPGKNWDWFLEETKEDSDDDIDDEVSNRKRNKGTRRKRKKGDGNYDEEWTGESEEDKEFVSKTHKVQRPKYSTRSEDRDRLSKGKITEKENSQRKIISRNEENEEKDEDKDDDTLGGFIVKDDEVGEDEDDDTERDEEEEEEGDFGEDGDED